MGQHVVDVTAGPPERRPRQWRARDTGILAAVLGVIVAAIFAATLWTHPAEVDIVGYRSAPREAWRAESETWFQPVPVGPRWTLLAEPGTAGEVAVRMVAEWGAELWRTTVACVDPHAGAVPRDLSGTAWVAVQCGRQVVVLERETGEVVRTLTLPDPDSLSERGTYGWLGTTERGRLVLSTPIASEPSEEARISLLGSLDVDDVRWTTEVPEGPQGGLWGSYVVEERADLLLFRPADGGPMPYQLALRVQDGAVPGWAAPRSWFGVAGGQAITYGGAGLLEGWDLLSGAHRWTRPDLGWGQVFVGDHVVHVGDERITSLDAGTGEILWQAPAPGPVMSLTGAGDQIILSAGTMSHNDSGDFWWQAPWTLTAFDARSGRQAWRVPLEAPVFALYAGEGQVIAQSIRDLSEEPVHVGLSAYRLSDGTVAWEWTPDDVLGVFPLGTRLAAWLAEGGVAVLR